MNAIHQGVIGIIALLLCTQTFAVQSLQLVPANQLPKFGTFWLAKGPLGKPMPPLPMPMLPSDLLDVPIYDLGNGQYLVDNSGVDYGILNKRESLVMSSEESNESGGVTNSCLCCSYPTNPTLKWFLVMRRGGAHWSNLALAPDGTLYVPDPAGSPPFGYLWAINTALVDTNDVGYPLPDNFAKWIVYYTNCIGPQVTPTIAPDGTIYTSSDHPLDESDVFSAISPVSGTNIWSFKLPCGEGIGPFPLACQPAIGPDGTVYFTSGARIYALTNAPGITTTFSASNSLCDNYTLNLTNVGIKWLYLAYNSTNILLQSGFEHSSPTLAADGTLFINSDAGQLLALNSSNGHFNWATAMPSGGTFEQPSTDPVIGPDGTIYFGANNFLFAVDPNSQTTNGVIGYKWIFQGLTNSGGGDEEQFFSSPVVGNGSTIYVAPQRVYQGDTNRLLALDSSTGTLKWAASLGGLADGFQGDKRGSIALAADGEIYVTDTDGTVYSFCPDGKTNWMYTTFGGNLQAPLIGPDGTLYTMVTDRNGGARYVYAFAGPSPVACAPWPEDRKNARRTAAIATASAGAPAYTNKSFRFNVAGISNMPVCICATADLASGIWTNLGQIILSGGLTNFVDTSASNYPARFYLAKPQ